MLKNLLLYFVLLYIPFNAALAQDLNAEQIYSKINNAVVTIYTFDAKGKILSQGSGVVLNDKGWVVTNYHVFAGAEKIVVKHQEKVVEYTKIVGLDVEKDILILQIKDNTFQSIKIG
ncbi:MAG TPA: trypsin-like peptidase domain-containing protein, partial [Chitinophagaceae bacterium]